MLLVTKRSLAPQTFTVRSREQMKIKGTKPKKQKQIDATELGPVNKNNTNNAAS